MDKAERDRLRALCEAATAGPWDEIHHCLKEAPEHFCCYCGNKATFQSVAWCYGDPAYRHHNIDFIAASRTALPAALDALDAAEAERDTAKRVATLLGDHTQNGLQLLAALAAAEQKAIDLRAKLDAAEARIADLEAESDAATATMEMATRTTEEIRRATVEAIVRRLRTIEESDPDVEWLTDLIEREFLTEKGE